MWSTTSLAVLLLGGRCLAQSTTVIGQNSVTVVSGIDPTDVAAIPEPDVLGPPVGVADDIPTIVFDAAFITSSVLALVTAATDAQTAIVTSTAAATSVASQDSYRKRAFVGGNTGLRRRDVKYPVDTKSYTIPNGYTPSFINLQAATQGRGYLTYKTLKTYDPSLCTAACDKIKTCVFANIYYEKDPDASGNPVDVIKCSLYSMFQTNVTAINKGQWRGNFQILVTGSNGYNKAAIPSAPAGYSMQSLPAAINAPILDSQGQGRLIQPIYLDTYSPDLCAAACDKQTQYDKSTASDDCNYKSCVYANLYILNKDGAPQTVVCALYTENTDPVKAVNNGFPYGDDFYQVSNSVALVNTGLVAVGYPLSCAASASDIAKLKDQGSDFCSSYLSYSPSTALASSTQTQAAVTVPSTLIVVSSEAQTSTVYYRRAAVPTPAVVQGWPATKISAACSKIATGVVSSTVVIIAATPYVTSGVVTVSTTVLATATESCRSQLVTNGDFTTGVTSWRLDGNAQVDNTGGQGAVRFSGQAGGYGAPDTDLGQISQAVTFDDCFDQEYSFTIDYNRADDGYGDGCWLSLEFGSASKTWSLPVTYGVWTKYTNTLSFASEVNTGESQTLTVYIRCGWFATVTTYVRSISIKPVGSLAPVVPGACQSEYLQNGDFSAGLTDWTLGGSAILKQDGSSTAVHISKSSDSSQSSDAFYNAGSVTQLVAFDDCMDQDFTLSLDYKGQFSLPPTWGCVLYIAPKADSDANPIAWASATGSNPDGTNNGLQSTDGAWTHFSGTFSPKNDLSIYPWAPRNRTMQIGIACSGDASGDVLIDNVSLQRASTAGRGRSVQWGIGRSAMN